MDHDFWKRLGALDGFLILLNAVLLLLLFTAGTGQTAAPERMPSSTLNAADQPEKAEPAFVADDSAFIAAMLAP